MFSLNRGSEKNLGIFFFFVLCIEKYTVEIYTILFKEKMFSSNHNCYRESERRSRDFFLFYRVCASRNV